MLRRVVRQQRVARWAIASVLVAGAGMSCYPPVLRTIYAGAAAVWTSLIHAMVKPDLGVAALVVLGLGLAISAVWEAIVRDF
jgi:hypothetical protein